MRDVLGKLLAIGGATGGGIAAALSHEVSTPTGAVLGAILVLGLRLEARVARIEERLSK